MFQFTATTCWSTKNVFVMMMNTRQHEFMRLGGGGDAKEQERQGNANVVRRMDGSA
jgi:hypothetical protein